MKKYFTGVLAILLVFGLAGSVAVADTPEDILWSVETEQEWNDYIVEEDSTHYEVTPEGELVYTGTEPEEDLEVVLQKEVTDEDYGNGELLIDELRTLPVNSEDFEIVVSNLDKDEYQVFDNLFQDGNNFEKAEVPFEQGDLLEVQINHEGGSYEDNPAIGYFRLFSETDTHFGEDSMLALEEVMWEQTFVEEDSENIVFSENGEPRTDLDETETTGVFELPYSEIPDKTLVVDEGQLIVFDDGGGHWEVHIENLDTGARFDSFPIEGTGEQELEEVFGYFSTGDTIRVELYHPGTETEEEAGVDALMLESGLYRMVEVENFYPPDGRTQFVEEGDNPEIGFEWNVSNTFDFDINSIMGVEPDRMSETLFTDIGYGDDSFVDVHTPDGDLLEFSETQQWGALLSDDEDNVIAMSESYDHTLKEYGYLDLLNPLEGDTVVGGNETHIDVDFAFEGEPLYNGTAKIWYEGEVIYEQPFSDDEFVEVNHTETVDNYEAHTFSVGFMEEDTEFVPLGEQGVEFFTVEEESSVLSEIEFSGFATGNIGGTGMITATTGVGATLITIGVGAFIALAVFKVGLDD